MRCARDSCHVVVILLNTTIVFIVLKAIAVVLANGLFLLNLDSLSVSKSFC